jgi:hypothetical protein
VGNYLRKESRRRIELERFSRGIWREVLLQQHRKEKKQEFLDLKQGVMIFLEYKRRFYDLSIFATTPPYRAFLSKVASGWA